MKEKIRAILFPLLVFTIIGSLWVVGKAQEMEDETHHGPSNKPPPTWAKIEAADDALAATPIEP